MMAMDASERELERAQQQAMEMLFQQYVDEMGLMHAPRSGGREAATGPLATARGDMASVMELLAQTCEDASDKIQELSPDDVAAQLMDAVRATQQSLRSVRQNVRELLADPVRMQALQQQLQATDEKLRLLQAQHVAAIAGDSCSAVVVDEAPMALVAATAPGEEDALRHAMEFAEHMCGVLDDALSTISSDEYELAAQLSLGIAQRMLEAGQALFLSLGEEERREQLGDRAERITIEEVEDDVDNEKRNTKRRPRRPSKRRQQAAVLRTHLEQALHATRDRAKEHPYLAAAVGAASMPFVGLAVPMASVVGLALAMEKYYPEHTTLTLEMMANFMQMMKLWLLLLKISARQLGHVAKQCLASWHEHAAKHGYVATGMELASTGCSLGWLCVTRLYSATMAYAARVALVTHVMGGKQSKLLKKELETLRAEAEAAARKHEADAEALRGEKRMLEYKLQVLQELAATAQLEAERATQLAAENEEKMKALKWELVRSLSVTTTTTTPASSVAASLSKAVADGPVPPLAASASPRVALNWELKEGAALGRASTTVLRASAALKSLHKTAASSSTVTVTQPTAVALKALPTATERRNPNSASATPLPTARVPSTADDRASQSSARSVASSHASTKPRETPVDRNSAAETEREAVKRLSTREDDVQSRASQEESLSKPKSQSRGGGIAAFIKRKLSGADRQAESKTDPGRENAPTAAAKRRETKSEEDSDDDEARAAPRRTDGDAKPTERPPTRLRRLGEHSALGKTAPRRGRGEERGDQKAGGAGDHEDHENNGDDEEDLWEISSAYIVLLPNMDVVDLNELLREEFACVVKGFGAVRRARVTLIAAAEAEANAKAAADGDHSKTAPLNVPPPPRFMTLAKGILRRLNAFGYASRGHFRRDLATLLAAASTPEETLVVTHLLKQQDELLAAASKDSDGTADSASASEAGSVLSGFAWQSAPVAGLQPHGDAWRCNVRLGDGGVATVVEAPTRDDALRRYRAYCEGLTAVQLRRLAEQAAREQRRVDSEVLRDAMKQLRPRLPLHRVGDWRQDEATSRDKSREGAVEAETPTASSASVSVVSTPSPAASAQTSPLPTGRSHRASVERRVQRRQQLPRMAMLRMRRLIQMRLCRHLEGSAVVARRNESQDPDDDKDDKDDDDSWTPTGRLERGRVFSLRDRQRMTLADFVVEELKSSVAACAHLFLVRKRQSIDDHLLECDEIDDALLDKLLVDFKGASEHWLQLRRR
ncbi:hypothetical protein ATCC90586_003563 [Pythium insidiosum]|nr:hypothetical protein ATCC90586_003563 [Pythium insidiosum]